MTAPGTPSGAAATRATAETAGITRQQGQSARPGAASGIGLFRGVLGQPPGQLDQPDLPAARRSGRGRVRLPGVYLTVAAARRQPGLTRYFTRRALAAGTATGVLGAASLAALHGSALPTFTRLTTGPGLPLLIIYVLLGATVLALLLARITRPVRFLAAGAFTAMIWGWGVAQYPSLLPGSLTLHAGAAPAASLITEIVIVGIIAVLVAPSFVLLYSLTQRNLLDEDDASAAAVLASLGGGPGQPAGQPDRSRPPEPGHDRWDAAAVAAVAVLAYLTERRRRRRRP